MRDLKRAVTRTINYQNLEKLIELSNFAEEIVNKSGKRVKSLTNHTRNCLSQTCSDLVELPIRLLGTAHGYVMLGNFTSDG